jgi:tetratricopeptide (TPR) repeat protein
VDIDKEFQLSQFKMSASKTSTHILLLVLVGIIIYSNSFTVPFQFDDVGIPEKPSIVNFEVFSLSKWVDLYNAFKSRFITHLTFAINYEFNKTNVVGYHLVNLTIHIINAILVYFLVVLTFKTPYFSKQHAVSSMQTEEKGNTNSAYYLVPTAYCLVPVAYSQFIALFSALIFVSHPIQTQAVTYISQRAASMATLFYLLSVVMYIKFRYQVSGIRYQGKTDDLKPKTLNLKPKIWYLGSVISAVLAMKTKEISFTFPIVIALYEFMFFEATFRKRLIYLIPLILAMLIIPLTFLNINKPIGEIMSDVSDTTIVSISPSRIDYLFTQFTVIVTYIRLLFLPINQNLDYDYPTYHSFFEPQVFLSFFFLLSIFGLGVYLLLKSKQYAVCSKQNSAYSLLLTPHLRLIAFGIFWFFITLSVESSIIPITDVIFEHRVYLPSIGVIIAFVTAVFYVFLFTYSPIHRFTIFSLLSAIIIIFSIAAYARNNVWKTDMSLWADVVKKSPKKARAVNNLGNAYLYNGLIGKAMKYYEKALILDPDQIGSLSNIALAYEYEGQIEKAIEYYEKVIKAEPKFVLSYYNLGNIYKNKGLFDKAIEYYLKTINLSPNRADAYNNLGTIYSLKGQIEKAIEYYQKALSLKPDLVEAHFNLANIYSSRGLTDKAVEHYQKAIKLNPDIIMAHFSLGTIYLSRGIPERAIEHYQKVLTMKPNHDEAHNNIGSAYLFKGLMDKAIEHYQRAVDIKPDNAGAYSNLCNAYLSKNLIDKAIKYCEKALSLKPDLAEAYNNLGIAYQSKGQLDKATGYYRKALSFKPDLAKAHFNLARIYYDKGNVDMSIRELEMAIKINPDYQEAKTILEELNKNP